jgi:hypothetical protein
MIIGPMVTWSKAPASSSPLAVAKCGSAAAKSKTVRLAIQVEAVAVE